MGDQAEPDNRISNTTPAEHKIGEGNSTMASDEVAIAGLADSRHLDMIDKLFACNVGQYISLPQIVVVGDQSSGKSSVLEGLTRLPFPRDSVLATRFATRIVFRRQAKISITVSVIPHGPAKEDHITKLQGWKTENIGALTKKKFSAILSEVHKLMGLASPGDPSSTNTKTFSRDILRIEICGPDQEHLSVIDVPGIFSRTQAGITTKDDKAMVTEMVRGFMENPRSIILAVVPANVDVATQEILEIAEEYDPDGQRTLGVLTKPDLVDEGAESNVIEILEGHKHKLNLGWHLVRNPGQMQMSDPKLDRKSLEEGFLNRVAPWKDIDKDKTGVSSLKVRLQDLLSGLVRREFPKVKQEINKLLTSNIRSLKDLGQSRGTRDEQFNYLLKISMEFRTTVMSALTASYGGNTAFESNTGLLLATNVVWRNNTFSDDMATLGHTIDFQVDKNDTDSIPDLGQVSLVQDSSEKKEPDSQDLDTRYEDGHEELAEILLLGSYDDPISTDSRDICEVIKETFESSRGFELGTFHSDILPILWKMQSAKWEVIALDYICDVVCIVHTFHKALLNNVCANQRVRTALESVLLEQLTAKYSNAISQVAFILKVERNGTPQTQNHYFNENLEKSRQQRFTHNINKHLDTKNNRLRSEDLINAGPLSNIDHTVRDIHDILKSYYKVARKRFVDTVCMQAADYHLLTGEDSPLKVFSPVFVSELSDDQLEMIAGEDVGTKRKRKQLKKEIADLEAGKKILV